MKLYHCELELHENLFFATREMGRLYECEQYLHNYALTYALGLANAPYFHAIQLPTYEEQLTPLNERGIYVTPASPLEVAYELVTFKYANNSYHVEMLPARRNTPSFGRAKEIAVGSRFKFAVLSYLEELQLPTWIRLGLWRSKAHLSVTEHELSPAELNNAAISYALNPLDVPNLRGVGVYDLISMRPTSVLYNLHFTGAGWRDKKKELNFVLPKDLRYRVPK